MDRYEKIGAKIKEAREAMELSQSELAVACGLETPTAISLIEAGKRKVAIEQLELIAEKLQTPLEHFLGKSSSEITLEHALRSDKRMKSLDEKSRNSIIEFAEFVRSQKNGRK